MLWIAGAAAGSLIALVLAGLAVLAVLGKRLPEAHEISATLTLARPREQVFAALADTAGIPAWDKGVDRVERLPDRDGHEVWRWHMGRNRMVLEITASEPPSRLVRTIADEAKFFSGDWTYELADDGAGSKVTLTEHGSVHVAIPRAMMHYLPVLADPSMYLKRHLRRLAERFAETPRIEVGPYRVPGL
jgi:uncharacterized protein YndB with AHSA1/START domain